MRIGVIGSGNIGGTAARLFADAGHDVAIANSRGPASLADEEGDGVRAATVEEACEHGEVVLLAMPLKAYTTLDAETLDDTVVIDAMNYYPGRDGQIKDLDDDLLTSTELVAKHLEGSEVVKAFNTLEAGTLENEGRPAGDPERLVLLLCGDDRDAKRTVRDLIDEVGFDSLDVGTLADGRIMQPGSAFYGAEITSGEARDALQ